MTTELRAAIDQGRDRWWTARAWATLGLFLRLLDRPVDAVDACRRAADGWAWVEDTMGEALAWEELALASLDAGLAEPAREAVERATALREVNGEWADPPLADLRRGTVLHELHRLDEAGRILVAGRARAVASGLPPTAYDSAIGWLRVEEGRWDEALERLADAERAWRASGHTLNTALLVAHRTLALAGAGRWEEASREAERASEPRAGAPFWLRLAHAIGALVALRRGGDGQRHLERWAPAGTTAVAIAAPLDQLVRAAVAGEPLPPPPELPSSLVRVVWRTFGPPPVGR